MNAKLGARRSFTWGTLSAGLLLATFAGCGGRLVNLPAGFRLQQRQMKLEGVSASLSTNASGPPLNLANEIRLREALGKFDYRQLADRAGPEAIPSSLRGKISPQATSGLTVTIKIDKVDVIQPAMGADWWLRVDVTGTLVDRNAQGTELWKYQHREAKGMELNGHKLAGLSTNTLLAGGGSRLQREITLHLRRVILKVLADLELSLAEAAKQPAAPTAVAVAPAPAGQTSGAPSPGGQPNATTPTSAAPDEPGMQPTPSAGTTTGTQPRVDASAQASASPMQTNVQPAPVSPRPGAAATAGSGSFLGLGEPHARGGFVSELDFGVSVPVSETSDLFTTGFRLMGHLGYQIKIHRLQAITPELLVGYTRWGWQDGLYLQGNPNWLVDSGGQGMFNLLVGGKYTFFLGPIALWSGFHLGFGHVSISGSVQGQEAISETANGFAINFEFGADYMFLRYLGAGILMGTTKTVVGQVGNTDVGAMGFAIGLHIRGKIPL